MAYQTEERLKSYLDTNQLHREQLCRAVLALDKRFSEVRPRHPRGGPDGGRDIEAVFKKEQRAFGAVGFVNGANDSSEQKRDIKKKFREDLSSALTAASDLQVFVFLTNINLTVGEKDELVAEAKAKKLFFCEVFDRERLRITLDEPDGFSARFQYLGINLSAEEQASFFAKWGDDIQSLVTNGFQRLEATIDRVLFLQESSDVLSTLTFQFELDRTYAADEIGHFRAFCYMHLVEPKLKIFQILFGASDRSNRFRSDVTDKSLDQKGIKNGIGGVAFEEYFDFDDKPPSEKKDEEERFTQVRWSSGIGMDPVQSIWISYSHADSWLRFEPRLQLRDFDGATYLPNLNSALAEKVKCIHVYANGYKLDEIPRSSFKIDASTFESPVPHTFDAEEMTDPWVRIRPQDASAFAISFASKTPLRLFESPKTADNRERNHK